MGGRETRWGAIVRADNLGGLTEAGQRSLIDHAVQFILDLRTPEELRLHPNPFASPRQHGVAYSNVSLVDPAVPEPAFTTLADVYKDMLDRFTRQMAEAITAIARAPDGTVVIHCMAGKDRTGLISAILLGLVGVPRDVIASDYNLTEELLRPHEEEWIATGSGERVDRERDVARFTPHAHVMADVLAYLDENYGGVDAYVRAAGVTAQDINRLRDRLLVA